MLASIKQGLAKVGLHVYSGKCSVERAGKDASPGESIALAGDKYPLCGRNEGFKVLGAVIAMSGSTNGELAAVSEPDVQTSPASKMF